MEQQKKSMPAAKAVTLVAFAFLAALGALFLVGLIEFNTFAEKKTYGISAVIDEIKLIAEDAGGYFKGIWKNVQLGIKAIDKGNGIVDLGMSILTDIFPLVAILCFFMVAWRLAFCWWPLLRVGSIGWSRVAVRMGKRLKKVVGWVIGFVVYCFAVYGKDAVDFATFGGIALYLIAAYAILRVVIDGLGKKASIVHVIFTTISAAAIAVFLVIVLKHFLLADMPLWYAIFGYVENAVLSTQGEAKNTEAMISFILLAVCYLAVFISVQRAAKATEKQIVLNRGGVRKSLIWLLIWTVAAAALHFFAWKKYYGELSFKDWKDAETSKFMVKSVIYGAVGLGLAIVTPILNCIGRSKAKEEVKEYEE
ncbi:MAG: hypothetical protein IJY21_02925 [Clostridia bacterium]|nr:hypothetical protein [Clostridia bacterium]